MRKDKYYKVKTVINTYVYANNKEEVEDTVYDMFEKANGYKVVDNEIEIDEIEEILDFSNEEDY